MRKRGKVLALVTCLAAAAGAAAILWCNFEPGYHGHSLSYWLNAYVEAKDRYEVPTLILALKDPESPVRGAATNALRQIAPEALASPPAQ
jgi:HEAT repeat protein